MSYTWSHPPMSLQKLFPVPRYIQHEILTTFKTFWEWPFCFLDHFSFSLVLYTLHHWAQASVHALSSAACHPLPAAAVAFGPGSRYLWRNFRAVSVWPHVTKCMWPDWFAAGPPPAHQLVAQQSGARLSTIYTGYCTVYSVQYFFTAIVNKILWFSIFVKIEELQS